MPLTIATPDQVQKPLATGLGRTVMLALVVLLALVVPFFGACSREPASPSERGRSIFMRNCSGCHGVDGRGAGRGAPVVEPPPRNLTDPAFHAQRTDEQLVFVLRNGKGNMPPFGFILSDQQLQDVLAYLRTLPKASAPQ